jgi:hypothetical protein
VAPLPPVPFEDFGACPFEGCVYREWTAKSLVTVRTARQNDAPAAFTVRTAEKVTAVTGVVITVKAGRVQFRESRSLRTDSGTIGIEPGQTLYLLTYHGEGVATAWFDGRLYRGVDTVDFINGVCDSRPERCAGEVVEKSETEWWVQVRNRSGAVGWTNEPGKFDGKSAFGGDAQPNNPNEPARRGPAQERYVSASVDQGGALRIATAAGEVIVPEREAESRSIGRQVGFDRIQISANGLAVGWLALYPNCCTSYPIPLALVVYSNGMQRSYVGNGLPVWQWRFMAGGTQIAFRQETVHGGMGVNYELRDVLTGKLVAEYQPEIGRDNQPLERQHPPEWVKVLDSSQ